MEAVNRLLAIMFLVSMSVLTSVLVMIYGWGLQPKSWWWIIGAGVFVNVILRSLSDKITNTNNK